jgi:hypothetical protein
MKHVSTGGAVKIHVTSLTLTASVKNRVVTIFFVSMRVVVKYVNLSGVILNRWRSSRFKEVKL